MRKHWLRPISLAVAALYLALSVGGYITMRHVVTDEQQKILRERGLAASDLLNSLFAQEIAAMTVLGKIGVNSPADLEKDFKAGASQLLNLGVTSLAAIEPAGNGYVVRAAVGSELAKNKPLTASEARLATQTAGALTGSASEVLHEGGSTKVGVATQVGRLIVMLELPVDPHKPIPPSTAPFDTLRGSLYDSRTADPTKLIMTTETHNPLTGQVQVAHFQVGDDQWSLYYAAKGSLVGRPTAVLPWLVPAASIILALLVVALIESLSRRRKYADALVADRTRSLASANAELDEARIFLRHLVSAGPLVVAVVDADTLTASYVSPNIKRLFGVTESVAMAPGFFAECIDPEHLAEIATVLRLVADDPEERYETLEFPVQLWDSQRWLSAVFVAARGDQGAPRSVLVYALDIDEQHEAAEMQERARAAATAANRSKTEFLSRMSHELRTPLNAILGYAQLFEMTGPSPEQQKPVAQILESGRHLLDLINEVLDISRIETDSLSLSLEPTSVRETLATAADMVTPAAIDARVAIELTDTDADLMVIADRQRLRQVVLNLLTNAVKYNKPGGTVKLRCDRLNDETARISVTDDGPGISSDNYDLVFAPFERLGAQQSSVDGTGIGLTLSRRLAEAMGGTLNLRSSVGNGSTFYIDLPLATAADLVPIDPTLEAEIFDEYDEGRMKVLLIEDNPTNVDLIEHVFANAADVAVYSTTHGARGIELAIELSPDVILLDIHLPDLPGDDALRRLKADPRTSGIPVIVVSADATPGQIERLLAHGAHEYLTKPIDIRRLIDLVHLTGATR